jgi:hypothetical protein
MHILPVKKDYYVNNLHVAIAVKKNKRKRRDERTPLRNDVQDAINMERPTICTPGNHANFTGIRKSYTLTENENSV